MYTMNAFGLSAGSLAECDFRSLVEAVGSAGFGFLTLWPSHFEEALASGLRPADMRTILADNGVSVSELDPLARWLPMGDQEGLIAASVLRYPESEFYRMADALGARSLNVIHMADASLPEAELVDALGSLCQRASEHGLLVSVEFMAWSPISNLGKARELVRATGRSDCGVNIDTWHHYRTGGTTEEIAGLDADEVTAIQLSDVETRPWEEILQETARARCMPGDGAGLAGEALAAFECVGVEAPINLEVFSDEVRRLPTAKAAHALAEKVRTLI